MSNILIVGCGDIGIPLGLDLTSQGHSVWGLRRKLADLPIEITGIEADVCQPSTLQGLSDTHFDYVVITLTPASFSDEGYQQVYVQGLANLLAALKGAATLRRILFVSSTSVYHQSDGGWVDEESGTQPESFSGRRLLEAEALLSASVYSSSVIRFAGIYGPGRRRLIEQLMSGQGCQQQPPLLTNRIHRDDCVGFLAHLLLRDREGNTLHPLYIGVDSEPVPMWDLKRWMAGEMGIDPDTLTTDAVNRRNSKRCSNQRMLASGYSLRYPSYRDGYIEMLG